MMKHRYLIGLILGVALSGCGRHTEIDPVAISLCDVAGDMVLADYVEPVGFVALEETDSCVLNKVDKIIETPDAYYVMDKASQEVSKFDKSGSFIGKIGRRGEGPEEYARLADFDISGDNQTIYLCSPASGVLTYSAQTGRFAAKQRIETDVPFSTISVTGNGVLMTADNVPANIDRLYSLDDSFKVANTFLPRGEGLASTLCRQVRRCGDTVLFLDWCNNILYRYDAEKRETPALASFQLANDIKSAGINDFMQFMSRQSEVGFIMDWGMSDSHIVVYSVCGGKTNILILDRESMTPLRKSAHLGMPLDLNIASDGKTFISTITCDNYDYFKENLPTEAELPPFEPGKTNAILMLWRIK